MPEKIDLLLVNPGNRLEQFAELNTLATVAQPLGLAMLASYVRQYGINIKIIDAEAEFWTPEQTITEIEKYDPLLIGLSAFTTKMTSAGKILQLIKEKMPGVKTVIGGHHASAIPARTLVEEKVDFVVQGEGYHPLLFLINFIKAGCKDFSEIAGVWWKNGTEIVRGKVQNISNLDNLPNPAWDLLPMDKYRPHHWQTWDNNLETGKFAVLYTSLGCPFSCDYCSVNVVYGKNATRFRNISSVIKDLDVLVNKYDIRYLEIIDDTFTLNIKRTELLCKAIISHGFGDKLSMWAFARVDRMTPKLAGLMRKAGIKWVFMGLESGTDSVLQGVNKKQTVEDIRKAVGIARFEGLNIGGNYVLGLPKDNMETMQKTFNLAKELNTEYANFFLTMPYPGTKLFDVAIAKHYKLPEKWSQYGFFAPDALPMRNKKLSAKDILNFRDKVFNEYFGSSRYLDMIQHKFGEKVKNFIIQDILSKKIVRA